MNTVRVNAYAKLNLTLDITGAEGGYHLLDSVVVTIDLYDRIVVKKRRDPLVNITMHGMGSESIPPEANNACKAAEKFVSAFGTQGADITVYKNIPIGGGLGGSSADAAGVLNALAKLYAIKDGAAVKALADELGSDTRYLLSGGLARMQGRGEKITPIDAEPNLHFLLLCPKAGVSAGACYQAYDELGESFPPRTARLLTELSAGNYEQAARYFGNHLLAAAVSLEQTVKDAYDEVRSFSPLGAGMTGSGSACFALFETRELAEWAKSRYRGKCRAIVAKSVYPQSKSSWRNPFVLSEDEMGQEDIWKND